MTAGVLAYATYNGISDRTRTLDTVALEASSLKLYEDVRSAGFAESAAAASYLGVQRQEFLDRYGEARADVEASFVALKELAEAQNPAELQSIEDLELAHTQLAATYDTILGSLQTGDSSGALAVAETSNLVGQAEEMWDALETGIIDARARSAQAQANNDVTQRSLYRLVLSIAVGWTVVLVVAGLGVYHLVVLPLRRVASAARRIADGDVEARSPITGPLEVAGIAKDVNWMADSLIERSEQLNAYVARNLETRTLELEKANRALGKSEARFRSLVQNAPDLFTVVDAGGRVVFQSPSVKEVLGYTVEEITGTQLLSIVHDDDTDRLLPFIRDQLVTANAVARVEARMRHRNGSWRHLEISISGAGGQNEPIGGIVLNSRDITDRKQLEDELRHQAFHDSLTELSNRARFTDRLEHALARAQRTRKMVAVLFIDLDNFKAINDSYGHSAGDALLKGTAERIQGCLRAGDTAARLGGDEFAILLEDADDHDDTTVVAERVLAALESPFSHDGKEVFIRASIGIATASPNDSPTATVETMLRNADLAMYAAKRRGKSDYQMYEDSMHLSLLRRFELLTDLRAAVDREEFYVQYQPTVSLSTGELVGLEALVRWQHPRHGVIMPEDFISLAEESGVIRPLGRWVLVQACRQLHAWQVRLQDHSRPTLAVNVSVQQLLHPGFAQEVREILRETDVEPSLLTLEVTESITMHPVETTLVALKQLKAVGIRLAIDDFGMGSSSLSYLQMFPFDVVKIDKSFIQHDAGQTSSRELTRKVIELGKVLNLQVIAEGIEEEAQLTELRELDCEIGQGYLFAKPMDAEEVTEHILRGRLSQAA